MKKRIVALILVVVMSLLALSSCGTYNFAKENLGDYTSFNYDEFKAALAKLEIEDGDFTTNEETRAKLVAAKIYNAVADKIISTTEEDERVKEGELGAGDVLYFVYYAKDAEGNFFFGSDMNVSSLTASSSKANHVIKLGDYLEDEDDEFLRLVRDNLQKVNIKDYLYETKTNAEREQEAVEELHASKPEGTTPTVEEIDAAKKAATKVKPGDVLYISYTRSYKTPKLDKDGNVVKDEDGNEVLETITEQAAYEKIIVNGVDDPLHAKFLEEGAVAKYGSTFEAFEKKEGDKVTTNKEFKVTIGETEYTYSSLKFDWKVETDRPFIATFKYTPYDSDKKVTPDNLTATDAEKVNLKDVELTYYVFPVYAIDAPSYDEITAYDILYHVYSSKLTESTFDAFEEDYKNGDDKAADLVKKVAEIFDTKSTENEYYKEGGVLYELNKAYNDAVKEGGSKPTTAQQDKIDETKKALTDKQNELLSEVLNKLVEAKNGDKVLGDVIEEEYYENNFHSLKESYDADITKKVQAAVWKLIDESVKVDLDKIPEDLLKDYVDHLYEHYEYEFYKGNFTSSSSSSSSSTVTNYDKYNGSFDAYLIATLKLTTTNKLVKDELNAALEKEAKEYLEPIIKIYVVSKACEADALKVLKDYVQADIDAGAYEIHEEDYREIYGDKADKKIEEAKKNAEENKKNALAEAEFFIINDEFMKNHKKEIGRVTYNQLIDTYGEINLRAGYQFNKLFYYLTSANIELNEDGDHTETKYVERDGGKYLDFRTVTYVIKAETETDTDTDH